MASTSSKHTEERQTNTGRTGPCKRQLLGITLAASPILFIFAFSNAVWGPSIGPLARLLHTPVSQIQLLLESGKYSSRTLVDLLQQFKQVKGLGDVGAGAHSLRLLLAQVGGENDEGDEQTAPVQGFGEAVSIHTRHHNI
jgi:hypothetical protein